MTMSRNYIKFGNVSILARRNQEFAQKPLSKAIKIPRTEAGYCVTDDNIAAIDFGTTSVSLAYTIRNAKDSGVNTLRLDREDHSNRVPNAILLKRLNRRKVDVEDFGTSARKKFETKRANEYSQYVYFERIKMLLKRDKVRFQFVSMHMLCIYLYRVLTGRHLLSHFLVRSFTLLKSLHLYFSALRKSLLFNSIVVKTLLRQLILIGSLLYLLYGMHEEKE